jgi:hypothetical protein
MTEAPHDHFWKELKTRKVPKGTLLNNAKDGAC